MTGSAHSRAQTGHAAIVLWRHRQTGGNGNWRCWYKPSPCINIAPGLPIGG
jgi:hypothetical protein